MKYKRTCLCGCGETFSLAGNNNKRREDKTLKRYYSKSCVNKYAHKSKREGISQLSKDERFIDKLSMEREGVEHIYGEMVEIEGMRFNTIRGSYD